MPFLQRSASTPGGFFTTLKIRIGRHAAQNQWFIVIDFGTRRATFGIIFGRDTDEVLFAFFPLSMEKHLIYAVGGFFVFGRAKVIGRYTLWRRNIRVRSGTNLKSHASALRTNLENYN